MKSKGIFFAFLSGILLALSYPPISLGFFAWFALVPLFYYLFQSKDLKYAVILGFISSITSNLIILNWIAINSGWGPRQGDPEGPYRQRAKYGRMDPAPFA